MSTEELVVDLKNERSRGWLVRGREVVPGGVLTGRRNVEPVLCWDRARGARVVDVDGNELVDYHAAWGAIVLGHCDARVNAAVVDAIDRLVLVGHGTTPLEVELAEALVGVLPSAEQVLLTNSGTEATLHAVHLARAVTGRESLIKFGGLYHGFHDNLVAGSVETTLTKQKDRRQRSAGILSAAAEKTLVCRYNDLDSVEEAFRRRPGEIALIIVEPYAHNAGSIAPQPGFLEGLRRICDREGALLVFDEVITGFRHALGGYQSICGVTPDLTTIGKAMANGFPVAAVCGTRELMERFSTHEDGDVFVGGTYAGNSVATAAALATVKVLSDPAVYQHTYALGERMRTGLKQIADQAGIPATVAGHGSLFVMLFMEPPLHTYDDFLRNDTRLFVNYRKELIKRNILEMPDYIGCRSHISAAHTTEDIDQTLTAAQQALNAALNATAITH